MPLAPEIANDFTYSFEGGGRTQFRLTYYRKLEQNVIDVCRSTFARRSTPASIQTASACRPTSASSGRAASSSGSRTARFTFDANLDRAFSSSASQFAYNDLNAPAIAAGHLFPNGYEPPFTATLAYEIPTFHHRLRFTPSLSYESGFPYGNGKMAWVFDPNTGKPVQVPNDNYVNPGENYYFLADPSQPFNAATNPYIGNLGTPEGNDPNTLRTPPQTLVNLHIEGDVTPRVTLMLDIVNLFGTSSATAYQVNPYLIGPPGYKGGNAAYEPPTARCSGPVVRAGQRHPDQRRRDAVGAVVVRHGGLHPAELSRLRGRSSSACATACERRRYGIARTTPPSTRNADPVVADAAGLHT